jgi:hypothetical protein
MVYVAHRLIGVTRGLIQTACTLLSVFFSSVGHNILFKVRGHAVSYFFLGDLEISECFQRQKFLKKIKKIFQKFRKFGNLFFHAQKYRNLPKARGCRELDHTQYELERFGQLISISEN